MTIARLTALLPFGSFLTSFAVVPRGGAPLSADSALLGPYTTVTWIDIPSYQRGLSWSADEVQEFVHHSSPLLGNVVLGQFSIDESPAVKRAFPLGANNTPKNYAHIVDGLQRFATGTALLDHIDRAVMRDDAPQSQFRPLFAPLERSIWHCREVFRFNAHYLANHPRTAVASGYEQLRTQVAQYLDAQLNPDSAAELADQLNRLFIQRQVATDKYLHFSGTTELMATFLGLNTIRVELSPVDLFRALIVERADETGWSPDAIEHMENSFVDVFMKDGQRPRTHLLPFVAIILRSIEDGRGDLLFRSWDSGALQPQEVEQFLSFVADMDARDDPYLNEIRFCGALPFAAVLGFYYRILTSEEARDKPCLWADHATERRRLHPFLVAVYRTLLAGKVGKTADYALRLFTDGAESLWETSNLMASRFSQTGITEAPSPGWLRTCLELADQNRAKRIFNALLLPDSPRGAEDGAWGAEFRPMIFGRRATEFNVDHLIPRALKQADSPGALQIDSMANFAPLPANLNRLAKAEPCSHKLNPGGIYDTALKKGPPHPYAAWLTQWQAHYGPLLDDQAHLENNRQPEIGGERLAWLTTVLTCKL